MIPRWGGETPLVSCLMVTQAKRWEDGIPPGALAFQWQTYRNRELVIVTKDPHPDMPHLWSDPERAPNLTPWLRFVDVSEEAPNATLGELRQMAVDCSGGEFVATWDDDDLSSPLRLAEQVAALQSAASADAVTLLRVRVEDVAGKRRFLAPRYEWPMTMVARRDAMPPYPALPTAEDVEVVRKFARAVILDRPDLYTYRMNHGDNVAADQVYADYLFEGRTGGGW